MILAYHELALKSESDVYALSVRTFGRHAETIAQCRGNREILSFDDGHISNYELARPVLKEFGIPAIFFITTCWTGVLGSVMTWRQLVELSNEGFTIGSHTHTHPLLTDCSPLALRNELETSKKLLEDRLGKLVNVISLPGGRGNKRVLGACQAAGYSKVYTSRVGEYARAADSMPEVIGRYVVTRATTEQTLTAYLKGSPATWRRLRLESTVKASIKKLVGDSLYRRAWRKIARSQSYGT
jgi:peptidoglycan/xylan/chitin deacetylase (PgdA/CDA1 family)